MGSRPAWARGLKRDNVEGMAETMVAPCVGAWIETTIKALVTRWNWSRPAWARGLKRITAGTGLNADSRALRGRVD